MTVERAAQAVLENLRGRKLLKWLFAEDADENPVAIGYVDGPIDCETQQEIATTLARAVLEAMRTPTERMRWAGGGVFPGLMTSDESAEVWQAMIDTALSETGEKG